MVECSDLSEAGGDGVSFHLTGRVDFPLAACDLKADYASISDCQWVFCPKAESMAHCYNDCYHKRHLICPIEAKSVFCVFFFLSFPTEGTQTTVIIISHQLSPLEISSVTVVCSVLVEPFCHRELGLCASITRLSILVEKSLLCGSS